MTDALSKPTKPRRRWFQFSLRTLLIAVTLVAGLLAWRAYVEPYRRQRAILKFCQISRNWHEEGNVSRIQLVRESGISEWAEDLSINEVETCFEDNPELMDWWKNECEDIRGPGVWYFCKNEKGLYTLGFVANDMNPTKKQEFKHKAKVCAIYALLSLAQYLDIEIPAANKALEGTP